jgi:hypothetical protein
MIVLSQIDVGWAEKQHTNFVLALVGVVNESEKDRKPKKLSNTDLAKVMTD